MKKKRRLSKVALVKAAARAELGPVPASKIFKPKPSPEKKYPKQTLEKESE